MKPVIKWNGSKRTQAHDIVSYIPDKHYETYYEPFCGSCSVLAYIIEREKEVKHFKSFVCSDLNKDLIASYNLIKENPKQVVADYESHWKNLNKKSNTIDDKKSYFESIREKLNKEHNPSDFIFIMRTTTNGMPYYNKNGILPREFEKIVNRWSFFLKKHNVQFVCCPFEEICPNSNDLVYLDPPYANTKGMYFKSFDNTALFAFLERLECDWMLSYDGIAGNDNLIAEVPETLYKEHVMFNNENCNIHGSLYLNFEPEFVFTGLYLF